MVSGVHRLGVVNGPGGLTIGYVAHEDNPRWGLGRHCEEELKLTSPSLLSKVQAHGWEEVANMSKVLWQSHMPEVDQPGPLSGAARATAAGRDHKHPFWIDLFPIHFHVT